MSLSYDPDRYHPSQFDHEMCLKPPSLLWFAVIYLARAVVLPIGIGIGHFAGVDEKAFGSLRSLWSMEALVPGAGSVAGFVCFVPAGVGCRPGDAMVLAPWADFSSAVGGSRCRAPGISCFDPTAWGPAGRGVGGGPNRPIHPRLRLDRATGTRRLQRFPSSGAQSLIEYAELARTGVGGARVG